MLQWLEENWTWAVPLYCLANWGPMWYLIATHRQWDPRKNTEQKWQPFLRLDYDEWSYLWTMITHLFMIPRYILLFVIAGIVFGVGSLIMIGQDKNAVLHPVRHYLIAGLVGFWSRPFLALQGVFFLKHDKPTVDYRKWLGPDWKPTYDGAGIYVANHQCPTDILANFILLPVKPAYVSKAKNKNIPGVGFVMKSMQCVFVENRGAKGSKEAKAAVMR